MGRSSPDKAGVRQHCQMAWVVSRPERSTRGTGAITPLNALLLDIADIPGPAGRTRELSLLSWVSAGAPPFLIAHGDRDHIVLPSEGLALHHALVRAGARSRFELLGGAGHEGARFGQPTSLALTAAWLRARLCAPAA